MGTDAQWENWGRKDPYFGVLTYDKFRSHNLTDETKTEFFESGRVHIRRILAICRRHLDQDFSPKRALDFGCGAGRIIIPLAEIAEHVVGMDVSDSMLKEARKNCNEYSAKNVSLLKSDDKLSSLNRSFDFIHSTIVFQHIPVKRGRRIFIKLLKHLEEGGVCVIQFVYSKAIFEKSHGAPPAALSAQNLLTIVKRFIRRLVRRDPEMQMNPYNVNELFYFIQSEGVRDIHVELTDLGGVLSLFLFFQKTR